MKGSLSNAPLVVKGIFYIVCGIADILDKISNFIKKEISIEGVSNNLTIDNKAKSFYNLK